MNFTRYSQDMDGYISPDEYGRWITLADADVAIEQLRKERDEARKLAIDAFNALKGKPTSNLLIPYLEECIERWENEKKL